MQTLAPGVQYFDLKFLNRPRAIAAVAMHGAGELVLLDPGPASTLATLRQTLAEVGMSVKDVTGILLTHIHLDHAGAAGSIVREQPSARVYVHETGLPHMANPTKLLASATRLYGDQMQELWGEVVGVPRESMTALVGGERLYLAGRTLEVAYTPGHASHHVSYFNADASIAFVGDTAGVKVADGFILPPTPPPDINLELWRLSLDRIGAWHPETVFLTHFGPSQPVGSHIAELHDSLTLVAEMARRSFTEGEDDAAHEQWFVNQIRHHLRRRVTDEEASLYETSARFDLNWRGLARYWRKRS